MRVDIQLTCPSFSSLSVVPFLTLTFHFLPLIFPFLPSIFPTMLFSYTEHGSGSIYIIDISATRTISSIPCSPPRLPSPSLLPLILLIFPNLNPLHHLLITPLFPSSHFCWSDASRVDMTRIMDLSVTHTIPLPTAARKFFGFFR